MNFDFSHLYYIDWSAISSIISFFAFLIIMLTLFEMKKQRNYLNQPIILFQDKKIFLITSNIKYPFLWIDDPNKKIDDAVMNIDLSLINIGKAFAVGFEIEWTIHGAKMIKIVNERIKYNDTNGIINLFSEDSYSIVIKRKNNKKDVLNHFALKIANEDIIIHEKINIIKENAIIGLPKDISTFLILYHLSTSEKTDFSQKFELVLPVDINIKYKTVDRTLKKEKYSLKCSFESFISNKSKDGYLPKQLINLMIT